MLKRILNFSVEHRYLVLFLTFAASMIGLYALSKLPIDAVPDITNRQVQINTTNLALSPTDIEKQVTFPIETALAGIPGLVSTRSLSRNGFSQVTAIFRDDVDIYFARQQVGERLSEAKEALPENTTPRMSPISTGLGEVYMWSVEFDKDEKGSGNSALGWQADGSYKTPEGQILRSQVEMASYLRTVQDWIIRPQMKSLEGIAGIDSIGGYLKQYHVQPSLNKMLAYGLTFEDLITALEKNNVSTGAGYIERKGESYLVRANGRLENPDDIASIVVKKSGKSPVYVRDVATVGIGKELRTGSASLNGEEVVVGTALMLIGENSRKVSILVDKKLKEISKSLPASVKIRPVLNRTKLVDATIATVSKNLAEGAILVIVVLFLLLGNIRAALITAMAIPISMLFTAFGMVQWHISGNLMSLGAIDFGLIVDGAVIIVENCLRRLSEKQHELHRHLTLSERLKEVTEATKEMIQPSIYGQAIIITVYLPILALTGIEGKTFHPMAYTVIFALIAAFILSLTFIPAMIAIFIKGDISEKESRIFTFSKRIYEPTLQKALLHRKAVLGVTALAFIGSLFVFRSLGQEFIPTLDEKDISLQALRIPSTGITQSTSMQLEVEKMLAKFPEVDFVFSKTGTAEMASDPMPPNASDTFVILKPQAKWPNPKEPKAELIKRMETELGKLGGNVYEFTQPIQMRFNELIAGVRGDLAVKVYGDDYAAMGKTAQEIAQVLQKIEGAADVKVEQTTGLPVMNIKIRRDRLARFGLDMAEVQDIVSAAIGGREAGVVFEGDRKFDVIVRLPDNLRDDPEAVSRIPVPLPSQSPDAGGEPGHSIRSSSTIASNASFVPLGEIADIETTDGQNQISRENGKRRIVVQANVRGRDIGSFVAEAQEKINSEVKVPSGNWLTWGGQFENLIAARERLSIVVPIAFILILVLLFGAFNSAKYALIVFAAVPLALSGGVVALWARDLPFSISAAVGFIALSGVAVLNGLVIVSFINQLRREGASIDEAIMKGCLVRLRPVMMTAMVAALGFLPMALATGTGAEVQKPLATVVVGGLISCTLLTLVVLPSIYRIFAEMTFPRKRDVEEIGA